MGNVIYLDQKTAAVMNLVKGSIKHAKSKNVAGKYDEAIEKDEAILRSFFDDVLGRSSIAA